jgi:transcriptional regulator with XRE-family HTH domain
MKLQKNLKKLRKDRNLSQKRVSDLTGIQRSTLSGYENGYAEPNVKTLIALAGFYDTTLDGLVK